MPVVFFDAFCRHSWLISSRSSFPFTTTILQQYFRDGPLEITRGVGEKFSVQELFPTGLPEFISPLHEYLQDFFWEK